MSSILIVDDEAGVREVLSRWLAGEGYEIVEADTAEAALEAMARVRADVVLCDVEMPGHGRLWLAAQLRDRYPMSAMVLATAIDSVWHVDAVERSLKPAPARESMSTWLDSSLDNE